MEYSEKVLQQNADSGSIILCIVAGPNSPALVMEFLPHGDLKTFLTVSMTILFTTLKLNLKL